MGLKDYALNFRTPITGCVCMGLALSGVNLMLKNFTNLEFVALDIIIGILVYSATVIVVDANRIQSFVALVAPKFRKSVKAT
jgi:hypothetical protein